MADFVGTGGGDDGRDSFSVFEAEEGEENAPLFVVEDDDGDDDSDFTSSREGGGSEEEERMNGQENRKTGGKTTTSSSSSSYYAERRKVFVQQLKETEPKKLVLGTLSVLCFIKLVKKVSQNAFGVNQPGRGLKHRCNRCAKKDARVKCNRCKKAWYCSKECWKAAIKLEICECC